MSGDVGGVLPRGATTKGGGSDVRVQGLLGDGAEVPHRETTESRVSGGTVPDLLRDVDERADLHLLDVDGGAGRDLRSAESRSP